jgi:5-methylcytosine-specific restriction endonuclease McrBC regulatory subunit McrC
MNAKPECLMDNADNWIWLSELLQSHEALSARLGISLLWSDPKTPVLKVSEKVGSIHFSDPKANNYFKLNIHPKMQASIAGMLWATIHPRDKVLEIVEQISGIYPSIWLASIYLHELERFLNFVRPRGEELEEELNGSVRGRFPVDRYLKRNYFTQGHIVPCRFMDWTIDNLPNRILLYGLYLSHYTLAQTPVSSYLDHGLARRCKSALAEVKLSRIQRDDFVKVQSSLQGSFRCYREIIHLAKLVILILDPFAIDGHDIEKIPIVRAFDAGSTDDGTIKWDLIDMHFLFEEYVRAVTKSADLGNRKFSIQLSGELSPALENLANKRIELDRPPMQAASDDNRLIIDAKYKLIDSKIVSITPRIDSKGTYHISENQEINLMRPSESECFSGGQSQVNNSDIYQVIAYATHKDIQASSAALVYPVISNQNDATLPHYNGLGWCKSRKGIPVYILTVRVDQEGIANEVKGRGLMKNIKRILASDSEITDN